MTAPPSSAAATAEPPVGVVAAADPGPPRTLTITVYGVPVAQGSKRGYVRGGRVSMVESSKKLKPWRDSVTYAAVEALAGADFPMFGRGVALHVSVTFWFPRPAGHYRTGRNAHLLRDGAPAYPAGRPDVDKTLRSTLDSLTDAGVFADDAQVVTVKATKRYAGSPDGLSRPGALIHVRAIP